MSDDLKRRVREAFDEVRAPEDVKLATLAHIKDVAALEEAPNASHNLDSAQALTQAIVPESSQTMDKQAVSTARRSASYRVVSRRAAVAIAACLALAAIGFGGFTAYAQPTAYVDISVNPSIELSLNRFGVVVESSALDDEGRVVLDAVELKGLRYADALDLLAESAAFAPYVQADSFVAISVTSDDEYQTEALCTQSDAYLNSLPCQGTCSTASQQTREAALSAGMGAGRYLVALELMELDSSVTLEDCADMTMRELRNRIATLMGDEGEGGSGSNNGNGHNAGNGSGNNAGSDVHAGTGDGTGRGTNSDNGHSEGAGMGTSSGNGNGDGTGRGMGQGVGRGGSSGNGSG